VFTNQINNLQELKQAIDALTNSVLLFNLNRRAQCNKEDTSSNMLSNHLLCIGCSFKFQVGFEESIVKAPRITDRGSTVEI
jgi:hypothetical protein